MARYALLGGGGRTSDGRSSLFPPSRRILLSLTAVLLCATLYLAAPWSHLSLLRPVPARRFPPPPFAPLIEDWRPGSSAPTIPMTGLQNNAGRRVTREPIVLFPFSEPGEANRAAESRLEMCGVRASDREQRRAEWEETSNRPHADKAGDEEVESGIAVEAELEGPGCSANETKVVLLSSYWFVEGMKGVTTGEAVWARSIMNALYAQNYTMLFSSLGWVNDDPALLEMHYARYAPHVRAIIAEPVMINNCYASTSCLRSASNPTGIPPWLLLSFHYWDSIANPLGAEWTLSPSPHGGNRFISYTIEAACQHHPYVPEEDRPDPKQVYLFGKQSSYFSPSSSVPCPWTIPFLATLAGAFRERVRVVMGAANDDVAADELLAEHKDTLHNLGKMSPDDFLTTLSRSSVFVGVGRPAISPSPFDALCVGVPFVNPLVEWDAKDPMDKRQWVAQQWWMLDLEPPYVYHVWAGDEDSMELAIQAALDNPIESFIPDRMTVEFVQAAIASVVEEDWQSKGEDLLANRRAGETNELFAH